MTPSVSALLQKRRGAEQFRMRPHDQVSRNGGEVAAHPALGLEPGAEFGLREELQPAAALRRRRCRRRRARRAGGASGSSVNLLYHPVALSELNSSYASFGLALLCTTALTAAIIAFGASDWKMLRPMSTPAAPCCTAL